MRYMTPEQQKLAEDNYGLVFKFLTSRNLPIDEYHGHMAMALCFAAMGYDPSKGYTFSTYAYQCMHNKYVRLLEDRSRVKRRPTGTVISLDELVFGDDETTGRVNNVRTPAGIYGLDETSIIVRDFCSTLSDRDVTVVHMCLYGCSLGEIAKVLHTTKQNVCLMRKNLRQKWQEYAA